MTSRAHPGVTLASRTLLRPAERDDAGAVTLAPEMPVLLLLRSELFRLRKRPMVWVMLLLVVATAIAFYGISGVVATVEGSNSEAREMILPSAIMESGAQLVPMVAALLCLVICSTSIGNEYAWGTVRPLVARAGSRTHLLTAKWISVTMVTLAFVAVGMVSCIVCSIVTSAVVTDVGTIDAGLFAQWAVGYLRVLAASAPYLALAFTVTLLGKSTAMGVGTAIGVAMFEPVIWALLDLATNAFDRARTVGLQHPAERLMTYASPDREVAPLLMAEGFRMAGVTMAWTVLFVAVAYWVFRRRDVTV